eukprot:scaffold58421_cov42-Prasinocladus_malaysianus.AAC.1
MACRSSCRSHLLLGVGNKIKLGSFGKIPLETSPSKVKRFAAGPKGRIARRGTALLTCVALAFAQRRCPD